MNKIWLVSISAFLVMNCTIRPPIPEPKYRNYQNLGVNILSINIKDERKGVKKGEIEVPFFAMPNKKYKHVPFLKDNDIKVIKESILEKSLKNAPDVNVNVYIQKGDENIETGLMKATMTAKSELTILISFVNSQQNANCSANSNIFITSGALDEKQLIEMLNISFKSSTKLCLEKIKEEFEKILGTSMPAPI